MAPSSSTSPPHQLVAVVAVTLMLITLIGRCAATSRGCVELDDLTFDRVLQRYPDGALIKFDVAYPYGEKQEAYETFAADVAVAGGGLGAGDLLVGAVGIKNYGEKDNAELAKRFAVSDKYPDVLLFVGGAGGRRVRFPVDEPFTPENLKQFVRRNSRIMIGLAGCVPELDALARRLVAQLGLGERDLVDGTLAEARKWVDDAVALAPTERDALAGPIYLRLMELTVEKGLTFVPHEVQRVKHLLTGKLAANKRRELEQRVNVLKAFESIDEVVDSSDAAFGDDEL